MGCLVLNHEHEGLVALALALEPIDGEIGDDIGAITVYPTFAVWKNHVGVVVKTLAREDRPVVEAFRITAEVAFAVNGCLVASLLEELGKSLLIPVEGVSVVHESVLVTVLAGLDDGAAGTADRVRTETVFKEHSLSGEFVYVGGGVDGF
jgi:hypothetical protein